MRNGKFFENLAMLVAGGESVINAAAKVGCSASHAYTISATSEFKQRVAEIRLEITTAAVGVLTNGATQAAATLVELLKADNEPKDRLAAAKAILASLGPVSELVELRERLRTLENNMLRVAQ